MTAQEVREQHKHINFACTDEYIQEALDKAGPSLPYLLDRLKWMNNGQFFGNPAVCHIFADSFQGQEHRNFYFEVRPLGSHVMYMNGGLIRHGDDWSIHT